MTTSEFIALHAEDDVNSLALLADKFSGIDLPFALSQIEGRQTARRKIPSWAAREGIVYPPRRAMEQCSSEAAARYKRAVAEQILQLLPDKNDASLADLTGGCGVDCAFLATLFRSVVYVERSNDLCETARKNFSILGLNNIKVVCGDAADVLRRMKSCTMIYLDPDRRDANGRRKYALNECSPDVTAINSELLRVARTVLIKCSPMLDWRKAVSDMPGVRQVHIVATDGECKELLLVLTAENAGEEDLHIVCYDDGQRFSFTDKEARRAAADIAPPLRPDLRGFLLVPNAAIMKAGCFDLLSERYGVRQVARNSHLFLSQVPRPDFPAKCYEITAVSTMNKSELRVRLQGISAANIAVRNFPLSADALRQRLCLADGGAVHIFGTTDSSRRHILLFCRKV